MQLPLLTSDLAHRLDMLDAHYVSKRMAGIKGKGIEIHKRGTSTALMAKNLQNEQFNSIRGFRLTDEMYLEEMLGLYEKEQIKVRMDILPGEVNESVSSCLYRHNIRLSDFSTVFYREPVPVTERPGDSIRIRKIDGREIEVFLETYLRGFEIPKDFLPAAMKQRMFWIDVADFHLYLAEYNGVPAGAAVLYMEEGLAYLAGASTIPAYRKIGIQHGLLASRINEAILLGGRLICSNAGFNTASQRNMQRIGFQVAFTKAVFKQK